MKSKDLLKKLLPVGIALVVIAIIAILITVLTKDKTNPSISKENQSTAYFTYEDGKIKFTNAEAYEKAKSQYGISILVDMIDEVILADEVGKITDAELIEEYTNTIFGYDTIKEYIEENEIEDGDDGTVKEQLQEVVDSFVSNSFASYGIRLIDGDIVLNENAGEYSLSLNLSTSNSKNLTSMSNYMRLVKAKYNYAYAKLAEQYAEEAEEYAQYKIDYAKYEQYLEDLTDYKNGDLADKPEEVEAPTEPSITISEDKFQERYDEENVDEYWAVVIPFSSSSDAETALLQNGIVIKSVYTTSTDETSSTSKAYWFHYGTYDATKDTESSFTEDDYDGFNIITKSSYYKELAQAYENDNAKAGAANADTYGAYVLSESEIKAAIVKLYNQYYYGTKSTTVAAVEACEFNDESQFYYTAAELTSLSLLTTVSGNKFNEYAENKEASASFRKFYSESVSSSYPKIYWILNASDVDQWEDLEDEAKNTYLAKQELIDEFLEDACTSTIINNKIDELRVEKGLIIYDTDLEADYLDTYTSSSYEETKKSNKTIIAKCGDVSITADQLLDAISEKYAVAVALEEYQYQWMFLYATNDEGELYNKYFDYEAFVNGKELKKCIYDTDEAEELWDEIAGKDGTITNIKNNFASGSYESYGFAADYGWKNFLKDFFSQYYGVTVTNNDELAAYLIYQQIVEDYQADVADITKMDWALYQADYVSTLNKYINCVGYHFLIKVEDEEGNTVDPSEWSADQIAAAEEFYAKLVELVQVIGDKDKEDVETLVSAISTAFDSILKYPVDENGKLVTDQNLVNSKGVKKFDYTYTYEDSLQKYSDYTLDLAKYKSLGLSVTYESLTTTADTMVKEFEDAVREYWVAHLDDMLDEEADGEYEEIEYKTSTTGYIKTSFGYHFYVNTSCNLTAYYSEDEKVTLPTKDAVALYQYEANFSSDEDYVSIVDLVADYREAVQLEKDTTDAKEAVVDAMAKVNYFTVTSDNVENFITTTLYAYTNIAELEEDSTSSTKKIDVDDLENNTLVQTKITSWYTTIAEEYTGSYYYQLCVLNEALKNADKIKVAAEGDVKGLLEKYVESYQAYLTYNKGDKDRCEALLEVLDYNNALTVKFSQEDYDAVKDLAKSLYAGLSAEDQADLKEDYDNIFDIK